MKGDRKRSKKPIKKDADKSKRTQAVTPIKRDEALPLQQNEVWLFKDLVDQSNYFGKLLKQYEQYEFALQDLIYKRKKLQQGKIKLPILLPFAGNSLYQVNDKKMVLKDLDTQITVLKNSISGIKSQMIHRRDEFIESGLRTCDFLSTRFGKFTSRKVGVDPMQTGVRRKTKTEVKKDDVLFEAEFDKILKSPELQKEFKEANEMAKEKEAAKARPDEIVKANEMAKQEEEAKKELWKEKHCKKGK